MMARRGALAIHVRIGSSVMAYASTSR